MASKAEKLNKIDVANLPGPTPRVEEIKDRFIKITPEICVERAQLITASYKETEDQPINIRRAKSLEKILNGMTIFIGDGELIVGNYYFNGVGHISVDYAKVLSKGLNEIIAEAKNELAILDFADPDDLKKMHFLNAVVIANEAVIAFAGRFAAEADKHAAKEQDPARKAELQEIARICRKVPGNPAETFWDAVQSFWFIQLVLQLESNGHSISPMRFDQYMYPYLVKDTAITAAKAQELLDLLYIKFSEINKVRDEGSTKAFGGYPMFQNLIVGGINRSGEDSTNELSFMCLQATANTKLYQPSISIRIHEGTPTELYKKANAHRCRSFLQWKWKDTKIPVMVRSSPASIRFRRMYP